LTEIESERDRLSLDRITFKKDGRRKTTREWVIKQGTKNEC